MQHNWSAVVEEFSKMMLDNVRPDAYQTWRDRDARMMRRVLPIFQKILP